MRTCAWAVWVSALSTGVFLACNSDRNEESDALRADGDVSAAETDTGGDADSTGEADTASESDAADTSQADCGGVIVGAACGTGCLPNTTPEAQCACKLGQMACLADGSAACLDPDTHEPVLVPFRLGEVCDNGVDDDCDGQVDEQTCEAP